MGDYLYNIPNATSGLDAVVIQTFDTFPFMGALILLFVYLVVFLGGVTRQLTRNGTADYSAWSLISAVATLMVSLILSINSGYIQLDWLLIVVSLNIMSALWFFLDKKPSEI